MLFNGRPLTLANVDASSPAILEAWFPGIEAGNAVADVLFGKVNPGGKLPVSFPRAPRPDPDLLQPRADGAPVRRDSKYNSRYRDLDLCDPLYPFGFGLSYTTFSVTNLRLDTSTRVQERQGHRDGGRDQHRQPRRAMTWCSCTSMTPSRASSNPFVACADSSG